jgi:hypothetical protein
MCDKLVEGVTFDVAIPQNNMDKAVAAKKNHASYLVVRDDCSENEKWE